MATPQEIEQYRQIAKDLGYDDDGVRKFVAKQNPSKKPHLHLNEKIEWKQSKFKPLKPKEKTKFVHLNEKTERKRCEFEPHTTYQETKSVYTKRLKQQESVSI